MKKKTAKLRSLERKRYSIITEDLTHCFICGCTPVDMHEVYGGCHRLASMKNGLCIPLCRRHHQIVTEDTDFSLSLKLLMQFEYEKTHTRAEFMKIIGRNYL